MDNLKLSSTIYPKHRPNFNDWCKEFKVSQYYFDRSGIHKAQIIMSLWDGYSNTKQYFVSIKIEEL